MAKSLDLSNKNIAEIPKDLPQDLDRLDLHCNKIIKIKNQPSNLRTLNLGGNRIKKIENLSFNLYELYLGYNKLIKIENLSPNLHTIILYNNQITKIENLPPNLHTLLLDNNQITKIENLPPNLNTLSISNNRVTKIENLSPNLHTLNLGHNQITKIENLPPNLRTLHLYSNKITSLPLELCHLRYLTNFTKIGNPIEHIPLPVQRWLDRLNNRITNGNLVYSDGQNVHNHHIQNSFKISLQNIMADKNPLNIERVKQQILDSSILTEQTKREIINYCDENTTHSIYLITYAELLQYIWSRIIKHSNKNDILGVLNQEISDGLCMCWTGRFTRLLNTLVGFYPDIQIQISDNEQITNIIITLNKKYQGNDLKEAVKKELEERNFSKEIIKEWIGYI
jgi:Leucine-rich repeat (LRR) protein